MCYIIESDLTSEERNTIPDDEFGLPNERKYPLHDKKRVKSAISYFYKCPKKDRYELAYNIQKAAEKFNVDIGSNTEIAKYLDENTEESWNNYVLEMITKINYSDQFTVLEQTKAFNFFQSIWKMIITGFRIIGRLISSLALWIWEKIQLVYKKFSKKGSDFIEVPLIFKNLRNILSLTDKIASDVSTSCFMLINDLKDITNNINNEDFILTFGKKREPWIMNKLSFIKNSGLCFQQANFSIGDPVVQKTVTVNANEVFQMFKEAKETVNKLNTISKEVFRGSKAIDDTSEMIKYNYSFLKINVRKAFSEYALSAKELISDAVNSLHMTSESIHKVVTLTNAAIAKQVSVESSENK